MGQGDQVRRHQGGVRRARRGRSITSRSANASDVRFGSLADIPAALPNVRFTPESGHWNSLAKYPLCAISRYRGTLFDHLVGAGE